MSSTTAVVVSAVAAVAALVLILVEPRMAGWWRAPRIAMRDLRACRRLSDPTVPVTKFFEWRTSQWSKLAGGLAALGVTLLVALVGAHLDSDEVVEEKVVSADAQGESSTTTTTTTSSDGDAQVVVMILVGTTWVAAAFAWQRTRVAQNGYTQEVGRLMRTREVP